MDVNLNGELEVFLITNFRKSYVFAQNSIEKQKNVNFKFTLVKNKTWIDACNYCLEESQSKVYLRVDDDMFLHPRCLEYFYTLIRKKKKNDVCVMSKLWEPSSKRVISSVKCYDVENTKKVGFEIDERGRVDILFKKKSISLNLSYSGDKKSCLGIHCACPLNENMKYVDLRNEKNKKHWKEKHRLFVQQDEFYKKSGYQEQYKNFIKLLDKINKKNKTSFWGFVSK